MITLLFASLLRSPFVVAVSLALALVSVTLSVIFYFKNRRTKKACYSVVGRTLIEGTQRVLGEISVLYRGKERDRITVSKLGIWNAGTEPLRAEDIATAAPLCIEVPQNAEVLSCSLLFSSDPANRFAVTGIQKADTREPEAGTLVPFSFEYLNPMQGAVIQLVHTGDWAQAIRVRGKIVGGEPWLGKPSVFQRHMYSRSKAMQRYANPRKLATQCLAFSCFFIVVGSLSVVVPLAALFLVGLGCLGVLVTLTNLFRGMPKDVFEHLGRQSLSQPEPASVDREGQSAVHP